MTPKEKANELVYKFWGCKDVSKSYYIVPIYENSKQCALIAVKEISDLIENMSWIRNEEYFIKANFWEDVQKEIEKL